MAKAAGNSDSPEPVVTAPVVDSTQANGRDWKTGFETWS